MTLLPAAQKVRTAARIKGPEEEPSTVEGAFMHRQIALCLAACLCLTGCGGPTKGTISGRVTLDGRDLPKGNVMVGPMETSGSTKGGPIKDGWYKVKDVTPGKVMLIVNLEVEVPSLSSEEAMTRPPEKIPMVENNAKEATVVAGGNTIDFDLRTKK